MKFVLTFLATALFAVFAWAVEPVNINAASAEQISEALKGVGQSKAEAIVAYRDANGQFKQVDELVNVKGIGIRTVDINREFIMLSDDGQVASK